MCARFFPSFFGWLKFKFTHEMNFYGSVIHASRYCKFTVRTAYKNRHTSQPPTFRLLFRFVLYFFFGFATWFFFSSFIYFLVSFLTAFLPFFFCTHSSYTYKKKFWFVSLFPLINRIFLFRILVSCPLFIKAKQIGRFLVVFRQTQPEEKKIFRPTHNSYHITQ